MFRENRKNQREESLKLLYAMNINEDFSEGFIDSYIENNNFNKNNLSYLYELLLEYLDNADKVDEVLNKESDNYKFNRISLVDMCIIRLSITEMLILKIPDGISINEAVELSKQYSDKDSYKVVNSILGKIVRGLNDWI